MEKEKRKVYRFEMSIFSFLLIKILRVICIIRSHNNHNNNDALHYVVDNHYKYNES